MKENVTVYVEVTFSSEEFEKLYTLAKEKFDEQKDTTKRWGIADKKRLIRKYMAMLILNKVLS